MADRPELFRRAVQYSRRKGLILGNPLGSGVHGSVFAAENQTEMGRSAIKIHDRDASYRRERDVYLRLRGLAITEIHGCAVPGLLDFDDDLLILEMTVVTRPYVLDFGGAHLDRPLDFSDEVMADWHEAKKEQFGEQWPEAQAILRTLEGWGIFVEDVNPNNIAL